MTGWECLEGDMTTNGKKACAANDKRSMQFLLLSPKEFRRISNVMSAKKGWDILQVTHEGIKGVQNSKLQMLTLRFEEIRMSDNELFDEFYTRLNGIVTSSFNLGEKIADNMVVTKILMSLP